MYSLSFNSVHFMHSGQSDILTCFVDLFLYFLPLNPEYRCISSFYGVNVVSMVDDDALWSNQHCSPFSLDLIWTIVDLRLVLNET